MPNERILSRFSQVEVDYDAIIEEKREEFEREWAEYTTVMDD